MTEPDERWDEPAWELAAVNGEGQAEIASALRAAHEEGVREGEEKGIEMAALKCESLVHIYRRGLEPWEAGEQVQKTTASEIRALPPENYCETGSDDTHSASVPENRKEPSGEEEAP